MKHKSNIFEAVVHGIFLILGLITVGCVLLITIYLIISGIPAIRQIGLFHFLFGKKWASTAAQPEYGILPFILTSVYGTAGAVIIGVPIGFLTAVYLALVIYAWHNAQQKKSGSELSIKGDRQRKAARAR